VSLFDEGPVAHAHSACAVCGLPTAQDVWGEPLCGACYGRWAREARVAVADVEAALPATVEPQPGTPAHSRWLAWWCEVRAAEWQRRTRAWTKRVARAAA
jgi:hypothetical protein